MQQAGIYKITNNIDGKFYIGSTKDVYERWPEHKTAARGGYHSSAHFQYAWNKYGEEAFGYEPIEFCEPGIRLEREQHYLDELKPWDHKIGYNISKIAGAPPPPPNKPIERIDPRTGEIKEYRTRDEAVADGFNEGSISSCCRGNMETHASYWWRFADGSTPEFVSAERICPVDQLSLEDGSVIASFESITAAAKSGAFSIDGISSCCLRKTKKHGGFGWRFSSTNPNSGSIQNTIQPIRYFKSADFIKPAEAPTPQESKPVDRIDPKTGEIKAYASIGEAVRDGFDRSKVSECCRGLRNSHKGFIWKSHDSELTQEQLEQIKQTRLIRHQTAVRRIDLKTGETKVYESQAAVEADGFSQGMVSMCCTGKRATHQSYGWEFVEDPAAPFIDKKKRPVRRIDPKTGETKDYPSQAEAAKEGFTAGKISDCCLGRRKTHGGFGWQFI